ncbi:MAG: PUR family DNA/RNA-binding protein [Bacteroidaceae bacterium]|nr:PUR family DNA/RNA-binding protein [Bacteroidaceae bacterium]
MQDNGTKGADNVREILFSKSIKAGKRIYYIDVKQTRSGELFLSITESKKVSAGEGDDASQSYEKHKIFLYGEDFEKFTSGLYEAIAYIEDAQGKAEPRPEFEGLGVKMDMEFGDIK